MTLTLNPAILRLKYSLSSRESCRSTCTCTCACALLYFAVRCEVEAKRIERLVEVSANESLLCCVKVYCDWMRVNPHIIATCAKVRHLLLCCVCNVNFSYAQITWFSSDHISLLHFVVVVIGMTTSQRKPKAPSFQIGSEWNLAGLFFH